MTRHLALSALVHGSGGHIAGWRHPEAYAAGQLDFAFHAELARLLERGRFDAFFVADVVAIWGHQLDSLSRTGRAEHFEPLTLLSALSTVTSHIGLVGTATTTYHEPYHIARKFASLDHLSHGRAGWNIVTSVVPLEAANFGRAEHLDHTLRYRRADEFVDVVRQLWDSFSDKAVVRDVAGARYYDPDQLRPPEHHGEHFRVRGPLNISRPPQGHPVLFQAGSSETGQDFAARHGEVLFTAQPDLAAAQAFSTGIKARVTAAGRDPGQVRVWPLLSPLVAGTEAAARRKVAELDDLLHDDVARRLVQDNIGDVDLTGYPVDGPLPEIPESNRSKSRRDLLLGMARRDDLTIRQLARRFSGGSIVAGTPEQLADRMQEWFTSGAADGFTVSFPYFPGPAIDFVQQVVPILRRRGLVPDGYHGTTLRENLGLARPEVSR
ncbi:LLM class flavin-dependent oxidoreductase [Amycolatopsis sp. cmx-4-83]|uniref:LLM class flavin-dependent oxidoreductase n=1 Tax=Amycolatopsis sp. cmx-4-83 TaxID=2790940 RepID=UPI00397A13D5